VKPARSVAITVIAVALAGVFVFIGTRLGSSAQPGHEPVSEQQASVQDSPVADRAPAADGDGLPAPRVESEPAPLPSLDAPFAEVFDELRDRAARGDHRAACRLAAEAQRCGRVLDDARSIAEIGLRASQSDPDIDRSDWSPQRLQLVEAQLERVHRLVERVDGMEQHCSGAPGIAPGQKLAWWHQSARAGNPAAVRGLISGDAFPPDAWFNLLPQLEAIRRDLLPMAWRAHRAGDLEASIALKAAYADASRAGRVLPLSQVVEPDEATALALAVYVSQARQLVPAVAAGPDGSPVFEFDLGDAARMQAASPEALREAQAQASAWLEESAEGVVRMGVPERRARDAVDRFDFGEDIRVDCDLPAR